MDVAEEGEREEVASVGEEESVGDVPVVEAVGVVPVVDTPGSVLRVEVKASESREVSTENDARVSMMVVEERVRVVEAIEELDKTIEEKVIVTGSSVEDAVDSAGVSDRDSARDGD